MQAALRDAVPIEGLGDEKIAIADRQADVETLVMLRYELCRIEFLARELSPDQQFALACELSLETGCEEACRCCGWSPAKYRKVAQRARARLRLLMVLDEQGTPPERDGAQPDRSRSIRRPAAVPQAAPRR